jgi:hypothetical protein
MVFSNGDFILVSLCALKVPEHRTQFLLLFIFLNNHVSYRKPGKSVMYVYCSYNEKIS